MACQDIATQYAALLRQGMDVSATLRAALEALAEFLDAPCGVAYLARDGAYGVAATMGLDDSESWRDLGADSLLCLATDSELVTLPLDAAQLAQEELARRFLALGYSSMAILPLRALAEREGLLCMGLRQPVEFTAKERASLDQASALLGLYIKNRQLAMQLDRQARESQTVYTVSRAFVSTPNLDDLLNLIVHAAVDTIIKADNCVLHLFDEATQELHARALSFVDQARSDAVGRSRMRLGQGVAGVALESGQVINVPDVDQDARFIRARGATRAYSSMMVAPLRLGANRIGTLSVDSTETNAFSPDDARLLMTLATQAAAAIENARLVHDLQQSLDDLKRTQDQLIQSEKLSAIGQLIAGVAHELNNPLTAVMGYTQLLRTTEGVDPETAADLDKIYAQAQRAAKIVENLLTFARQKKAERRYVNVNDILERTLELRAYQLQVENIRIAKHLDRRLLGVMADPNQLQQVFLNLINNAQDAMSEYRGGGLLTVTTELRAGRIRITFADDGPGLTPEVKQHLFEPFFTTKEVGKGTGLGLSICFGIVSQYNGTIRAEGELDAGASFIVELPLAEPQPIQEGDIPAQVAAAARGKRVLIVDDEAEVAEVLLRILTHDSHQAMIAHDGEMALRLLAEARESGTPFDLMISDIKMPGLSGPALYAQVRELEPKLAERVIFITGDTMSPATYNFLKSVSLPYLTKPFTISDFRRIADKLLH
jgi:C4-dicarboxylate-specific signal transduction histidine kinase/ActR/RegA family two-component response regulator